MLGERLVLRKLEIARKSVQIWQKKGVPPSGAGTAKTKDVISKRQTVIQELSFGCGQETRMPLVLIQQAAQVSQKNIRLTVHATDKKKGYLKDLI